jgi:hypothetical protein
MSYRVDNREHRASHTATDERGDALTIRPCIGRIASTMARRNVPGATPFAHTRCPREAYGCDALGVAKAITRCEQRR